MQVLRKLFGNFKFNTDYKTYFENVQKFVSSDVAACNEILFTFLDINKDRKVCETDLFLSLKTLNSPELLQLLSDDIIHCMTFIE